MSHDPDLTPIRGLPIDAVRRLVDPAVAEALEEAGASAERARWLAEANRMIALLEGMAKDSSDGPLQIFAAHRVAELVAWTTGGKL